MMHADVVGADETGLDRQDVQPAAPVELQPYGGGEGVDRALDGGCERRHTERAGLEAEEQVMHGGIAHHHHVEDVGPRRSGPLYGPFRPGC